MGAFAYEAKAAGDTILQSVRAGDVHTTKGYHRYQAAKNADGYMIYRSEKKNSGYRLLATTTKTIYRDNTTKSRKTYYYKIVSYCTNESWARVYSKDTAPVKITIKKENISVLDLMLEQ